MSGKNSKALFIEGESSEAIASLRQGFNKLFTQLLAGKMPKIYMAMAYPLPSENLKRIREKVCHFY